MRQVRYNFGMKNQESFSVSDFEKEREEQMADLRSLAELFNLTIEKEEIYMGTPSIVVLNEKGEEVYIGFPDGRKRGSNGAFPPATTRRIAGLPMGAYGHGTWEYSIKI